MSGLDLFSVFTLLTSVASVMLGIFVIYKGSEKKQNKLWAMISFTTAIWSFGLFMIINSKIETEAIFWNKILYLGAIFIPVLYFHFICVFLDLEKTYRKIIYFFYIIALVFLYFNFTSPNFIKGAPPFMAFKFWLEIGWIYYIFEAFFIILVIWSFIIALRKYKTLVGLKKAQIRYILYAGVIGFIGGATNFFPQTFGIYPAGNYFVFFYVATVSYAIAKYRLMNIRLIITRSILYGILVASVAAFFALSVVVVGELLGGNTRTSKIITYLVTSFIVVVTLEPVKRTWAHVTDKIFYKDKINYQEVLQQAGTILAREIDLQVLLEKLAGLLTKQLKIKNICIVAPHNGKLQVVATTNKDEKDVSISDDFVNFLLEYKDFCIVEELIRDTSRSDSDKENIEKFVKEAEKLKLEVVLPVIEEKKLRAIFLISGKQSGDLYNDDDVNFFKVLSPQIANALEKSKLYEEVEDFNRELQAKVEERTKSLQEANVALEDRNKFLTTMQVVINMVSRTLDLKKVNQMIADAIAKELGYVGGMLSFVDKGKNVLKVGAITANEHTKAAFKYLSKEPREYQTKLEDNYNLSAQTFMSGKINFSSKMSEFLSPPVDKKVIDKIQKSLGIKTIVGVPIFSEAKIIGVIQFYLPVEQKSISSLDIEIMGAMANQVGIVSRNLSLYKNLQKANLDLQDANLRLRELDKAKSEFLSIASHQLRTPISAIKGYLSMMIDGDFGKVPKNINDVIKNLFESASRLARLINIFLNVSRIESGRLKLEKKPIQINELIDGVMIELAQQAKQKDLKLTYKKDKKAPPLIWADSDKLREVVLNLVDNAIKYTQEGSVDILVEHDKKNLTFKVKDTGIGIDPTEAKTLFRKFVRGSGVAQIHTGGSGLGLFIAQKIIKEHNGRIWVESEGKGKGSVFQFVVPVYDGHQVPEYKKDAEEGIKK